jgi:hypothetical protein
MLMWRLDKRVDRDEHEVKGIKSIKYDENIFDKNQSMEDFQH